MKYILVFIMSWIFSNGCRDDKVVNENPGIIAKQDYLVEVDSMPMPRGGMEAIQSNIVYPAEAKEKNIQGKVIVQAFVDENGNIKNAEVMKGIDPLLDKAALDAIIKVKFSPGYKDGKAVKTQVVIHIVFKLNGDSKKDTDKDSGNDPGTIKKEGDYFIEADEMPEIIGGINAITEKIVYPESEKKAGIQGDVLIAVYIDENGSIEKNKIVKGVNTALNNAALEALDGIKFTPGKVNGKSVKTKIMLPVRYKLQ